MMCFRLPQWVIQRIDKARRHFLWGKSDDNTTGLSLTNWEMCRYPKICGGLGLTNLAMANISLLLRWWWKLYREPNFLWSIFIRTIRRRVSPQLSPNFWLKEGSFFWRQLGALLHIFVWSSGWEIDNRSSISFWNDSWNGIPRCRDYCQAVQLPLISLRHDKGEMKLIP